MTYAEVEHRSPDRAQAIRRRGCRIGGGAEVFVQKIEDLVRERGINFGLTGKIGIDGSRPELADLRYLANRYGIVAFFKQKAARSLEDGSSALLFFGLFPLTVSIIPADRMVYFSFIVPENSGGKTPIIQSYESQIKKALTIERCSEYEYNSLLEQCSY